MKKKTTKFPFARLASALLVLVLLSSYAASGLFAKYVTSDSSSDDARAAKWGVQITGGGDLFASTYTDAENNVIVSTTADIDGDGVTDRILAPGTSGEMAAISITGTPEVAVRVKYKATVQLNDWVVDNAFYCPLDIYVNGSLVTKGANAAEYINNIVRAIETSVQVYFAGTDLSTKTTELLKVTWNWPIDGDDVKDTALGDAATPANIAITIQTIVEQIGEITAQDMIDAGDMPDEVEVSQTENLIFNRPMNIDGTNTSVITGTSSDTGVYFKPQNGEQITMENTTITGEVASVGLGINTTGWTEDSLNSETVLKNVTVQVNAGKIPVGPVVGVLLANNAVLEGCTITGTTPTIDDDSAIYDVFVYRAPSVLIKGQTHIGSMYVAKTDQWLGVISVEDARIDQLTTNITQECATAKLLLKNGASIGVLTIEPHPNLHGQTSAYKPSVEIQSGASVELLDLSLFRTNTGFNPDTGLNMRDSIVIEEGANVEVFKFKDMNGTITTINYTTRQIDTGGGYVDLAADDTRTFFGDYQKWILKEQIYTAPVTPAE